MPDVALAAKGEASEPLTYVIPGAQEILIKTCRASFDGSAAAGDFVPTLRILDPNGNELAACPVASTVAMGSTVDTSWFPRGGVGGDGRGGVGIQFGGTDTPTYGPDNSGDYLHVTTTGVDDDFVGQIYTDTGGGGIQLNVTEDFNSGIQRNVSGEANSGIVDQVQGSANNGVTLSVLGDGGNGGIGQYVSGAGGNLGIHLEVTDDDNEGISNVVSGDSNDGYSIAISGTLNSGIRFMVGDLTGSGRVFAVNNAFELWADGSLHGLTGQTLTFDL